MGDGDVSHILRSGLSSVGATAPEDWIFMDPEERSQRGILTVRRPKGEEGKTGAEALICSTNLPRLIGTSFGSVASKEYRSNTLSLIFFLGNAIKSLCHRQKTCIASRSIA
jgi:hypothetical protein